MRRFRKSRQSVSEFCRQEGVSAPSFYSWRKRLNSADSQEPPPPAGFRPVRLLSAAGVSVQLPGGTQLVVPLADAESLRLVIETVARADAERESRPC
jgi:transposase-like protein